ncbi:4-alpha-glucanotransferase [Amycolatopsis jiangsuensis]|uniref:4-alpha-glucanotransferase n=1 Tax=Amycolatopsis jiangsuensis TaxID=1181879 RepID=A0A840IL86_9PSEU|nr:4-alpha-glucanotransferase [Amycolatopsis jiangsuensis]
MQSPAPGSPNPDVSPELAELAAAHGVATRYENSDQVEVAVDADVVVAVLAQLDVDASTPEAVRHALAAVREARASGGLPPALIVRYGQERELGVPATVELEDGTTREVGTKLPAGLPLGWHEVVTADRRIPLAVVPDRLPAVPPAWGWMLQLYALHSDESWGMGDFGDLAVLASRSAAELGAGVLLVNPVQAVAPAHPVERSPYSPSSRRFANPLYLRVSDTEAFRLADAETRAKLHGPAAGGDLIDYDAVWTAKRDALELLRPFHPHPIVLDDDLRDFATFCALAEVHGSDWRTWPERLRDPGSAEVAAARTELAERIEFHGWLQQLCHEQLEEARRSARAAGMPVGVVHDLPVGVHPGGADTWAAREAFAPRVRVGAPPDAFNQQGQDWNLPPWRPDRLAEAGYRPFRDVVRGVLRHADGIRVDHVAGMWRLWWIPPGEPAGRGTYVHYDAEAMLGVLALEAHRAGAVVVGEDLGTVEDTVTETMHERGLLSSAVLWFQRDWDATGQPFTRPADWDPDAMASISTHDLPTVSGWLGAEHVRVRSELGLLTRSVEEEYAEAAGERRALLELVAREGVPDDDPVAALHTLLASAASRLVLTSPADVIGERRQPNLPGTVDEYPNWRIPLPVTVDGFFADPRVRAAVAPLAAARPLPRS